MPLEKNRYDKVQDERERTGILYLADIPVPVYEICHSPVAAAFQKLSSSFIIE